MRKITSLFKSVARVYLLISDKGTDSKLRKQAEAEGLTILGENGFSLTTFASAAVYHIWGTGHR